MYKDLYFWKSWPLSYQILYFFLFFLFTLEVLGFLLVYYGGNEGIMPWLLQTNLDLLVSELSQIRLGMFQIPIESEIQIGRQSFEASYFQIYSRPAILYGSTVILVAMLLLSLLTTLPTRWYIVGTAMFIFYLTYLNIDFVFVWSSYPNFFLFVTLITFIALSYSLHAYLKHYNLTVRFLAFLALSIALGFSFSYASYVKNPPFYLLSYGAYLPMVLALLALSMSSYEILYGFFYLVIKNNPQGGNNNLIHFSIISFFYLGNLLLLYLKHLSYLDLDVYYLDIHWILIINAFLGVWGYQKRIKLSAPVISHSYQSAFLYISLQVLAFSSMIYYHYTVNDSMTDVFQDFGLYACLGFGFIFFIYILVNFSQVIQDKYDIIPIIYEAKVFPLRTMRYFGLVIFFGLFINNRQLLYYQSNAGYYNGIADNYFYHGDYRLARINYQQAKSNDLLSYHANYGLAGIAQLEEHEDEELQHLKTAVRRYPSPQAFVRIAQIFTNNERPYNSLFALIDAYKYFPNSPQVNNNLALYYQEKQVIDSALYHLEIADDHFGRQAVAQNNLWAILAESLTEGDNLDSLPLIKNIDENLVGRINKLALYLKGKTRLELKNTNGLQKARSAEQFAFINNLALNQMGTTDSSARALIEQFEKPDSASFFRFKTQYLKASHLYYSGKVYEGIQMLASIPIIQESGNYNTILGLWLMEQRAFNLAQSYFDQAIKLGNRRAQFYKAIALLEAEKFEEAIPLWLLIKNVPEQESGIIQFADQVLKVFKDSLDLSTDLDKYNFLRYKKSVLTPETISRVLESFENPIFSVQAKQDLAIYYLEKQAVDQAEKILKTIDPQQVPDPDVQSQYHYARLRLLLAQKKYQEILNDQSDLIFPYNQFALYPRARALDALGNNKASKQAYAKAISGAPYLEPLVLSAADFYLKKEKDPQKAYDILVNAVRSNPNSIPILKAYALISPVLGLDYYAEDALKEIEKLSSAEDYQAFLETYQKSINEK